MSILMFQSERVPRFQRELNRTPRREKTPEISYERLNPQSVARCSANISHVFFNIIAEKHVIDNRSSQEVELRRVIQTIFASTHFSPSTASISLYYLFVILNEGRGLQLSHKLLFFGCLMVANKAFDDTHIKAYKWSDLCRMPSRKLIDAEKTVLCLLDWRVFMSPDEFFSWGKKMHQLLQDPARSSK